MEIMWEEFIMYINDEQGKWSVRKGKKYLLVEPSQGYIDKNTPTQAELDAQHNKEVLEDIKATDSNLLRVVEDLIDWAITTGFVAPQEKLDLINERKTKRGTLKK